MNLFIGTSASDGGFTKRSGVLSEEHPALGVSSAGDLEGDGALDVAVSVGQAVAPGSFAVHVVNGRPDWLADVFLHDSPAVGSTDVHDRIGSSLASAGDADGDGRSDLFIGAPGRFYNDDGHGYLIFGGAWPESGAAAVQDLLAQGEAARIDAFKASDGIGHAVTGLGDFTGDGVPDLALSAQGGGVSFQGESYVVFSGRELRQNPGAVVPMASLGDRGLRILGEESYDYAMKLAAAGDFDGDGLADLLVGAPSLREPQGKAYVVFGGPARTVRLYNLGGDGVRLSGKGLIQLGGTVQGGGDFNGDGRGDILMTDEGRPGSRASLFIVFGEADSTLFLRGDADGDRGLALTDAVRILGHLFLGADAPACLDSADSNDDGILDVTDAVYVLSYLFLGGPAPVPPFPAAGRDPTEDVLPCG